MRHPAILTSLVVTGAVAALVAGPRPDGTAVHSSPLPDQNPQQRTVLEFDFLGKGSQPKLGIPDFTVAGDPKLGDAAKVIADVLWADLDYEHEFYMIDRKRSASIKAAAPSEIPFAAWKDLGADAIVVGSVRQSGATLTVEIRVVSIRDDSQGKQLFGQSYQGCTAANPRYCAHSIADDMHKTLRDLDGVARTKIAFTSDRETGRAEIRPLADSGLSKEIFMMDYDGAGVRRLTLTKSLSIAPSWAPDGRALAYASYATQYPDVYVSTLDGRPVTRPAHGTDQVHNQNPAFSPDGGKLAFVSNRSGQTGYYDIWVVNRDGSGLQNITPGTPKSSEGAPTWSPSGNQIAFTSDRGGSPQIYIMSANGTGIERVTFDQHADRPTWSRTNFIAYTLVQPAGHDIGIIDLISKTPKVLTDGRGSNKQPTVSSNGRHIIFVTTRWGKEQLASIDIDGKNIRQLTNAGNNTYPNWSPGVR